VLKENCESVDDFRLQIDEIRCHEQCPKRYIKRESLNNHLKLPPAMAIIAIAAYNNCMLCVSYTTTISIINEIMLSTRAPIKK
jgi:hypothetical protein